MLDYDQARAEFNLHGEMTDSYSWIRGQESKYRGTKYLRGRKVYIRFVGSEATR